MSEVASFSTTRVMVTSPTCQLPNVSPSSDRVEELYDSYPAETSDLAASRLTGAESAAPQISDQVDTTCVALRGFLRLELVGSSEECRHSKRGISLLSFTGQRKIADDWQVFTRAGDFGLLLLRARERYGSGAKWILLMWG
jgi:hypothetical protein